MADWGYLQYLTKMMAKYKIYEEHLEINIEILESLRKICKR